MQKHRREIPYSAFLAARVACRALSQTEASRESSARMEDAEATRRAAAREDDDDVVVMTIN